MRVGLKAEAKREEDKEEEAASGEGAEPPAQVLGSGRQSAASLPHTPTHTISPSAITPTSETHCEGTLLRPPLTCCTAVGAGVVQHALQAVQGSVRACRAGTARHGMTLQGQGQFVGSWWWGGLKPPIGTR